MVSLGISFRPRLVIRQQPWREECCIDSDAMQSLPRTSILSPTTLSPQWQCHDVSPQLLTFDLALEATVRSPKLLPTNLGPQAALISVPIP